MSFIERFEENKIGRDFVCGDIHGQHDTLFSMLSLVEFDSSRDRLFLTGDIIDRGPDSMRCIELLSNAWCFSVLGNHEQMMVEASLRDNTDMYFVWKRNGGEWANPLTSKELRPIAAKLDALPRIIVVGEGSKRFNVLHAEPEWDKSKFYTNITDEDIDGTKEHIPYMERGLLWGRALIRGQHAGTKTIGLSPTFVGHSMTARAARRGNIYYIDGGSGAPHFVNARLMMACPTTGELHSWSTNTNEYSTIMLSDIENLEDKVYI